ncbi:hypothetical protein ACMFMG_007472 [Clarireedia jacksonii]
MSSPPPKVTLRPATPADFPTLALLEHLAFEHDAFSDVAFGRDRGSPEALAKRAQQLGELTAGRYVKAVIDEEGVEKIVGFAGWSEGVGKGKSGEPEGNGNAEKEKIRLAGGNVELYEYTFAKGDEYMFGACGDRSWIKLNILIIHPSYQRRGIGAKLLEEGLKIADERKTQVVLGASKFGVGLYKKYGFEEVHVLEIDLEAYEGGEGMGKERHVIMWRPAAR